MKRVTAFVGSARRRYTYQSVVQFMANLQAQGAVECEIVRLADYHLETCRGCKLCFDKGEARCPLADDRDLLLGKIDASDGIVLASPNYSFQVSGLMKLFLDRFGFLFHRPRFFGKTFTSIVTQGAFRGRKIVEYLDFVGGALGGNTVKGSCLRTLEPMSEKAAGKIERQLANHSRRFYQRLQGPTLPTPGLIRLMAFRMSRTSMRMRRDPESRDWKYYANQGWFDADYFYATRLGTVKRAAGALFDTLAVIAAKGGDRGAA